MRRVKASAATRAPHAEAEAEAVAAATAATALNDSARLAVWHEGMPTSLVRALDTSTAATGRASWRVPVAVCEVAALERPPWLDTREMTPLKPSRCSRRCCPLAVPSTATTDDVY